MKIGRVILVVVLMSVGAWGESVSPTPNEDETPVITIQQATFDKLGVPKSPLMIMYPLGLSHPYLGKMGKLVVQDTYEREFYKAGTPEEFADDKSGVQNIAQAVLLPDKEGFLLYHLTAEYESSTVVSNIEVCVPLDGRLRRTKLFTFRVIIDEVKGVKEPSVANQIYWSEHGKFLVLGTYSDDCEIMGISPKPCMETLKYYDLVKIERNGNYAYSEVSKTIEIEEKKKGTLGLKPVVAQ